MSPTGVRNEIFFREDIRSLLCSVDRANAALAVHLPTTQVAIYRAGFVAALEAVAAAFDVRLDVRAHRYGLDLGLPTEIRPGEEG
jgi:hypothetical protein